MAVPVLTATTIIALSPRSVKVSVTSNSPVMRWQYSENDGPLAWWTPNWVSADMLTVTGVLEWINLRTQINAIRFYGITPSETGEVVLYISKQNSTFPIVSEYADWLSFAIDESTAELVGNWDCKSTSYYHHIELVSHSRSGSIEGDVLAEWANVRATKTGQSEITLALTEPQKNAALATMSTVKSKKFWVRITTYSGANKTGKIGLTVETSVTATTSYENSAPIFENIAYKDTNAATIAVTGNDQYIVTTLSTVNVYADAATARNGATIVSYTAAAEDYSMSGGTPSFIFSPIFNKNYYAIAITAYDSRGYSTRLIKIITIIDYSKPSLSASVRRRNGVDNIIELDISGSVSSVLVDGVEKNELKHLLWVSKKTNEEWTPGGVNDQDLTPTVSGFNFSYSDMDLTDGANTFDVGNSYNFDVYALDAFGWLAYERQQLYIVQAKPLVSFRPGKVGINIKDPEYALHVGGTVQAYRVQVASLNVNNVEITGAQLSALLALL